MEKVTSIFTSAKPVVEKVSVLASGCRMGASGSDEKM
jgi:hypothetical protein